MHWWLRAIQDKHLICKKCDSIEGNIYHPTDVPKNLSKIWRAPKQKKTTKSHLHSQSWAQVKTNGIPESTCRLKSDLAFRISLWVRWGVKRFEGFENSGFFIFSHINWNNRILTKFHKLMDSILCCDVEPPPKRIKLIYFKALNLSISTISDLVNIR